MKRDWQRLNERITGCGLCPRLREYCAEVAVKKRRAYLEWDYWARPVANFGDHRARILIVGLAPAAHGANRTGRMFTGDRSGDWLYRALCRADLANQKESYATDDGLRLKDVAITAACHCAPPGNRPSTEELSNCASWFKKTVELLPVSVFVALGQIGWRATIELVRGLGWYSGPLPKFSHGATVSLSDGRWLVGSYHPSQQNTFTGRLTEQMLDDVFVTAKKFVENK